jgi:hypothetical protein
MAKKRTGKRSAACVATPNPENPISAPFELSSKTEAARSPETNQDALSLAVSRQEKIALLAYSYWVQRGCHGGSAEEDWLRAEREINLAPSSVLAEN